MTFLSFSKKRNAWPLINAAYGINMGLWATFLIIEEIFIAYSYEAAHIRLLSLELVLFLLIHLLHDKKKYFLTLPPTFNLSFEIALI